MKKRADVPKIHLNKLNSMVGKFVDVHSKKMGLAGVKFRIINTMPDYHWGCYGLAYKSTHEIILNRKFVVLNYHKYPDAIEWLVMHELMHLKLPRNVNHGREYAKACIGYGFHPHAINNGHYIDTYGRDRSCQTKL
jgi:predicted metal-dependent hydrolase